MALVHYNGMTLASRLRRDLDDKMIQSGEWDMIEKG